MSVYWKFVSEHWGSWMFRVLSLCAAFSSCSLSISVKDEKSENKIKSAPCNNGISRPFELTVSAGCSEFLISNSTVHYRLKKITLAWRPTASSTMGGLAFSSVVLILSVLALRFLESSAKCDCFLITNDETLFLQKGGHETFCPLLQRMSKDLKLSTTNRCRVQWVLRLS